MRKIVPVDGNITCSKCNVEQDICNFYRRPNGNFFGICKKCKCEYQSQLFVKNKEKKINYRRDYYLKNREEVIRKQVSRDLFRKEERSEYNKKYREKNKDKIIVYNKTRKKKSNPIQKLRQNISGSINNALRENGSLKKGKSISNFLNYSIEKLKEHLEMQFEPWMNWLNRGIYNPKTWNDNNQSTWTWQLDHIIPQSDLPYTSMEDENFKKCWSLDNLRPLSAKQNSLDGSAKIRHKRKT